MLLDRLPSMGGSHFMAARRGDPIVAEQLLELFEDNAEKTQAVWRPTDAEWTQQDELAAKSYDRLGEILSVLASQPLPQKVKPKKPPPHHPRPVRALDLARARRRNRYLEELDDEVEAAKARWRRMQAEQADN